MSRKKKKSPKPEENMKKCLSLDMKNPPHELKVNEYKIECSSTFISLDLNMISISAESSLICPVVNVDSILWWII